MQEPTERNILQYDYFFGLWTWNTLGFLCLLKKGVNSLPDLSFTEKCHWASKNVLDGIQMWSLMWKRTQVTELLWEARLQSHCGDQKMQTLIKSSQCPFPLCAKHGSVRAPELPSRACKTTEHREELCEQQSQQRDSDLMHQRPRETKLFTPARVCYTWGGPVGEEEAEWTPHVSPTSLAKGKPPQPSHLQHCHLLSGWQAASGLCSSVHLPKNIYLSRENNCNVKP